MKSINYAQKVADKILGRNHVKVEDTYIVKRQSGFKFARISFFSQQSRAYPSSLEIIGDKADKIEALIDQELLQKREMSHEIN
jgi:hypothetical protein